MADVDVLDPANWHSTKTATVHLKAFEIAPAVENVVSYLEANNYDLVEQNIALNNQDYEAAIAKHQDDRESALASVIRQGIADADNATIVMPTPLPNQGFAHAPYSWSMFLKAGVPEPALDIGDLTSHLWRMEYLSDGANNGKMVPMGWPMESGLISTSMVSFRPVFVADDSTGAVQPMVLAVNEISYTSKDGSGRNSEEHLILQIDPSNSGLWDPNISVTSSTAPNSGGVGERVIHAGHAPGDGDYATVGASPLIYKYQPGSTADDFYLVAYDSNKYDDAPYVEGLGTMTHGYLHFTKKDAI